MQSKTCRIETFAQFAGYHNLRLARMALSAYQTVATMVALPLERVSGVCRFACSYVYQHNKGLIILIPIPTTAQVLRQLGLYEPAKLPFLGVILFRCMLVRVAYSHCQCPLGSS